MNGFQNEKRTINGVNLIVEIVDGYETYNPEN
jgi:hypothetical protein